MNIQDFGALGEVVGGIAVIATLIYLARQIKQTNTSTHRNTYAQSATSISEFWLSLAKDSELHGLYRKMLANPSSLRREDIDRSFLVLDAYLSLMESYYLHNQQYDEKLSQARWQRILERLLNTPGGQIYWTRRKHVFHEEFAQYLSGFIKSTPNDD